jgi:hypothetical protein
MDNCTVSGNTSIGRGGGISIRSDDPTGTSWVVRNSTISGNSTNSFSGAIAFQCDANTLQIQNSTITGNTSAIGGGIGIANESTIGNVVNLESTIVSGNIGGAAPDLNSPTSASPPNVITAINCAIGSPNGFTLSASSSGNLPFGSTLNLGPLQNNGGLTLTHALLPGSPCINAGYNPAGLTTDQRGPGFLRVVGSAADIGAFEAQAPRVASVVIDDGSAQRSRVALLTIRFDSQVTFTGPVADAFTISRNGGGAVNFAASASVVNGVTVVTLTKFAGSEAQFGSLKDGRYTLTVLSNKISGPGGALDGDGDGQPGGNYTFGDNQGLFRFFGDINGDRHVDIADFGLFSSTFNLHTGQTGFIAAFDFNGDGTIDIADFGQFSVRLFTPLP